VATFVEGEASDIDEGMPNLSVLPCSVRIDDFQTNMAKARRGYRSTDEFLRVYQNRRRALRTWLMGNYDYVIVDCPPSLALQVKVFLPIATAYIVPSIPDRLSVRGSMYLADRIRRSGVKTPGIGTLWSLFRQQNAMHKRLVQAASNRTAPYNQLPRPFKTVIPNAAAIASATEAGQKPKSFNAKYTTAFAKTYRGLCREVIQRCDAQQQMPSKTAASA
jgi:chromosome partitioning protein